ncbi:MAG: M20/M25/M40 family metallo-hydrolase [Simkania negevensis]|nr:M20/M25/M40 family metallo-hydrolase [Simkania negevensis]
MEINGFGSGYVGKGFKTIIPGKAIAKLSCRLVPNQDPKKIKKAVEDFLKKNMAKGIDFKLELGSGGVGFIASPNSKIAKISASAYEEVFGKKCKRILCGATIPIAPELSKLVKGNLVLVGMGLPSDRPHSPNEHFGLDRFEKGVLAMVKIFELFAKQGK